MKNFRAVWKGFGIVHSHDRATQSDGWWVSYRRYWGFGLRHGITTRKIRNVPDGR